MSINSRTITTALLFAVVSVAPACGGDPLNDPFASAGDSETGEAGDPEENDEDGDGENDTANNQDDEDPRQVYLVNQDDEENPPRQAELILGEPVSGDGDGDGDDSGDDDGFCEDCSLTGDDGGDGGDDGGLSQTGDGDGDEKVDCTRTMGYWQTHNIKAESPSLLENWPIDEHTMMCGYTWLEVLQAEPEGDPWYILAHQFIAAQLNVAAGVTPPPEVERTMYFAMELLRECKLPGNAQAIEFSELLDDFNNGLLGPEHCG